jgi:hypothetical protein
MHRGRVFHTLHNKWIGCRNEVGRLRIRSHSSTGGWNRVGFIWELNCVDPKLNLENLSEWASTLREWRASW